MEAISRNLGDPKTNQRICSIVGSARRGVLPLALRVRNWEVGYSHSSVEAGEQGMARKGYRIKSENSAETVERRTVTKGNSNGQTTTKAQDLEALSSGLVRVREAASRDRSTRFTTLLHHVTEDLLRKAYFSLKKDVAVGIDKVTWEEYGKTLAERLPELHRLVQSCEYRAQPSKRVWIEKTDGRKRPIGIACLEDKIVQQSLKWVIQTIFEVDFKGFSYGARPRRKQHDALDAIHVAISSKKVSWVLDADVQGFFDNISHEWLIKFIEHRITDSRIIRLVKKFLRAGVSEDGQWSKTEVGTPQGAVISPLLANIYMHYVLDLWVEQWRKSYARGEVYIVRYVDDFVMGFQYKSDAVKFRNELGNRFSKFGLTLHKEKTRLIEFGRFAEDNRNDRGDGKPETFDFLGFTHICSKTRDGKRFKLHRVTIKERVRLALSKIRDLLRRMINESVVTQGIKLRAILNGYFNYHAIPGNQQTLETVRTEVCKIWHKVLNKRSQKANNNWGKMSNLIKVWIPHTRIRHPYPSQRFYVNT